MRILIVEDDIHIRSILCLTLRQLGQHEVEEASDGEEALKILSKEHTFDLILMDHMMPKKNGLQTLQEYLQMPLPNHTPIIFLSATLGRETIQKALDTGAIDYIQKPFHPQHICHEIEKIIQKYKSQQLKNNKTMFNIEERKKVS